METSRAFVGTKDDVLHQRDAPPAGRPRFPILLGMAALALVAGTCIPQGTTYFVRPDGSSAEECTGKADTPYPGVGAGLDCAWKHPFEALPPYGVPRIAGGDTLVIAAGGYMMGYGVPGADDCDAAGAFDCTMPPVPSGPHPLQPTRILGAGWNVGCANPPELWGSERPWFILNLNGSDNVEVACLEITDHAGCVEFHSGELACNRDTPPYGKWASSGISASDSENVRLMDLDIHGLAHTGIHAGRLRDWTLERVRISGNGWVGWDGDLVGSADSNSGQILFREVEIGWNGCGETYPGGQPAGCWAQQAGGYGDGLGTGATAGEWVFEDCHVHHNTSDGLDLLYMQPGGSVTVRRLISEDNAGNQLKTSGPALVENSLLVGNCAYFEGWPLMQAGDHCRAYGSTYAIEFNHGDAVEVVNSTIAGEGDCLLASECDGSDALCGAGSERLTVRNTVLTGSTDYYQPWEKSCLHWTGMDDDPSDLDYNLVWNVKNSPCPGAHDICNRNPRLTSLDVDSFDGHPLVTSRAVDSGLPAGARLSSASRRFVPGHDIEGNPRPLRSGTDRGAYELP